MTKTDVGYVLTLGCFVLFVVALNFYQEQRRSNIATTAINTYTQETTAAIDKDLHQLGLKPSLINKMAINCPPPQHFDSRYIVYDAPRGCSTELLIYSEHLDYKTTKQNILAHAWRLNNETDFTKTQNSWGAASNYSHGDYMLSLSETDGPNTSRIEIRRPQKQ